MAHVCIIEVEAQEASARVRVSRPQRRDPAIAIDSAVRDILRGRITCILRRIVPRSRELELDKAILPERLVGHVVDGRRIVLRMQGLDPDREVTLQRVGSDLARFPAVSGVLVRTLEPQTVNGTNIVNIRYQVSRIGNLFRLCTDLQLRLAFERIFVPFFR